MTVILKFYMGISNFINFVRTYQVWLLYIIWSNIWPYQTLWFLMKIYLEIKYDIIIHVLASFILPYKFIKAK